MGEQAVNLDDMKVGLINGMLHYYSWLVSFITYAVFTVCFILQFLWTACGHGSGLLP